MFDYFFFSSTKLFGRGIGTDLGACFSLVAGLASTQIYAQAVIQAESDAAAKKGLAVPSLVARSSRRILESPMAQAIGFF